MIITVKRTKAILQLSIIWHADLVESLQQTIRP
jgi:hypothetical protein